MKLINVGFGNMISAKRAVAVVSPDSAPIKRLIHEAEDRGMLPLSISSTVVEIRLSRRDVPWASDVAEAQNILVSVSGVSPSCSHDR